MYGYELLSIAESFNVCVMDAPIVAVCTFEHGYGTLVR